MTLLGFGYGDLPYGDGSDVPAPSASDECLVGTITCLSSRNFVAQRTANYGGVTEMRQTYPDARKAIQQAVAQELQEVRVDDPGQPQIVYLYLNSCAAVLSQLQRDGYGD